MSDRVTRAQEEAKQRLLREIEEGNAQVASLNRQLEVHNDAIAKLQGDSLEELSVSSERNPRDIAAEDALDTIVRLENTLKIVQRRNALLLRENQAQEKLAKDRTKVLERIAKDEEHLVTATGWRDDGPEVDIVELRARISEMISLEQILNKELVAADVLIKKKEQAVEDLEKELLRKKEKEEQLSVLYNDIRVKDRDCEEMKRSIDALVGEHDKSQSLIESAQSRRAVLSIASLQEDTNCLKSNVEQHRATRRKQDEIMKAQIFRARQLQTRIDIIMAALRDMKLDKEFERTVPKSSLVCGASKEEPQEVSDVVPAEEQIPFSTYLLLLRDNDTMRTSVARKDVMVLEKEATIQALEAKLESFSHSLNISTEQQDDLKVSKALEMDELQETLQQQHQAYRRQIETLLSANLKLRSRLMRSNGPLPPSNIQKMKF